MNQIPPATLKQIRSACSTIGRFARDLIGVHLYPYQLEAARAIIRSVFKRDGMTFVIIFSRQSGKDEVLAIIILFLMVRFIELGIEIVCAQPTFKPQTVNAMERLKKRGANFGRRLSRSAGYIMRLGLSRACYFSAEPAASQVGATADRLLVMNEAQDIDPAVYDKRFAPMAASGFATKVFSGTSWTSNTLLAREKRAALALEQMDGVRRVFIVDAQQAGRVNRYYQQHVAAEIQKLGRDHPFIRTQYFCEEIDAQVGMFNPARRALMQADEPPALAPPGFEEEGHSHPAARRPIAFLLDVAGQDESRLNPNGQAPLSNPGRDSTSLTIASMDLSSLETLQAPVYRLIHRQQWTGLNHLVLFGKLKSMVEAWKPQYFVMDATGVGEGLWAMLDKAFPARVLPVKYSQQVKSDIGWRYLAIIETGRLRDCCLTDDLPGKSARAQYDACQAEILPGPARTLRWGVPEGRRGPDGDLVHDDILMADSLVAVLDRLDWSLQTEPRTVEAPDPLSSMERSY